MTEELQAGNYTGKILAQRADEGLIASITDYDQDVFNDLLHYHVNPHFGFTIGGGFIEKKKEKYELIPGDIIYYHAGEEHKMIGVPKPSRRINLEIKPAFAELFDRKDSIEPGIFTKDPDSKFLMVKIYKELLENDDFSMLSVQMAMLKLIHQADKSSGKRKQSHWVSIVDEFLREQLNQSFTLIDMAFAAGVHPVTISKNFPRYFGCTLAEYMRKLRIEKALSMMKYSDKSLTTIAYECGFFDQSHFTRTFKAYLGFLPKLYLKT